MIKLIEKVRIFLRYNSILKFRFVLSWKNKSKILFLDTRGSWEVQVIFSAYFSVILSLEIFICLQAPKAQNNKPSPDSEEKFFQIVIIVRSIHIFIILFSLILVKN